MPRRRQKLKQKREEMEEPWREVEASPLNPPKGWSYGYCLDDGRVYFIRLVKSKVLGKRPEERRRRILKEWGGLEVRARVVDYRNRVIFLPPQVRRLEMPCFRFARRESWRGFTVAIGGELVDC